MNIIMGQGLLLQAKFANGKETTSPRTFLVININGTIVNLLNVSSITPEKAHKVNFPENEKFNTFKPPFMRPSFVKLDEIYEIDYFPTLDNTILAQNRPLNNVELLRIKGISEMFQRNNPFKHVFLSKDYLQSRNPNL